MEFGISGIAKAISYSLLYDSWPSPRRDSTRQFVVAGYNPEIIEVARSHVTEYLASRKMQWYHFHFLSGNAGDAMLDPHCPEKGGPVSFAVEDDDESAQMGVVRQLPVSGLTGNLFKKTRNDIPAKSLQKTVVDLTFNHKKTGGQARR